MDVSVSKSSETVLNKAPGLDQTQRRDRVFNNTLSALTVPILLIWIASNKLPVFSNRLYTPKNTYAALEVPPAAVVRHEFVLYNLHPWFVTITRLDSSCSCTTGSVREPLPLRLAPFHALRVTVAVNVEGRRETSQFVRVVGSDDEEQAMLHMHASVKHASR